MWNVHLEKISVVNHRIDLTSGATSVHSAPYCGGQKPREFHRVEINSMLDQEVIEPATTEWAGPIVFAPKRDGTVQLRVDYIRLNSVTQSDLYPIPCMDLCTDYIWESTVFSTLHPSGGYWQVEIDERDKDEHAFILHHGLYQFIRMPFGLMIAPGKFQRATDVILTAVEWKTALVYLNHIVKFFKTPGKHFTLVKQKHRSTHYFKEQE